jgi:hypothetical protein
MSFAPKRCPTLQAPVIELPDHDVEQDLGVTDPDDPVFVDTKRGGVGLDVERHDRCLLVSFLPELSPGTYQF